MEAQCGKFTVRCRYRQTALVSLSSEDLVRQSSVASSLSSSGSFSVRIKTPAGMEVDWSLEVQYLVLNNDVKLSLYLFHRVAIPLR